MRASFIVGEVLTGLRRNVTMTVAMILTTAITLAMFGGGLLVVQMANKSQQIFLDRVEIQVFLQDKMVDADPGCKSAPCSTLQEQIRTFPGVQSMTYIDRKQAFEDAKNKTFADSPEIASMVNENTLPASIKVRMNGPESMNKFVAQFSSPDRKGEVMQVLDQRKLVERVFSVLNGARNGAFAISVILAVAAILLIINTVQIAAYTRRTEVGIMRLVGATRWYTQLPFLLEAIVASMIGSILAIGGLFVAKAAFFDSALRELYGVNILARVSVSDVLVVAPWIFVAGITLSAVTAYATLRVYVRD